MSTVTVKPHVPYVVYFVSSIIYSTINVHYSLLTTKQVLWGLTRVINQTWMWLHNSMTHYGQKMVWYYQSVVVKHQPEYNGIRSMRFCWYQIHFPDVIICNWFKAILFKMPSKIRFDVTKAKKHFERIFFVVWVQIITEKNRNSLKNVIWCNPNKRI